MRSISSVPRTRVALLACFVLTAAAAGLLGAAGCASKPRSMPGTMLENPPKPDVEMRAMFVATAYNIDWPSKQSLHRRVQRDEIHAIIARAKDLNCNTIILQVRAFGDRIYRDTSLALDSGDKYKDEPWAFSLAYGTDPDPRDPGPGVEKYDPMREWIKACNEAGLELHAWINPFRVNKLVTVKIDGTDRYLPVVKWQRQLYLNPNSAAVQEYVRAVINDFFDHYPPESNASVSAAEIAASKMAMMMLAGGDGPEGVIYDHQIPDEPDGTTKPVGSAAGDAIRMMAAPVPAKSPAEKRVDYLHDLYVNAPANKKVPNDSTVALATFLTWSYDKVSAKGGRFGLSPDAKDKYAYARPQLKAKKVDYVLPELYGKDTGEDFQDDLRFWLDQIDPEDEDPPQIVPALFSTRTQLPPDGSEDPWPPDVILKQMDLVDATAGTNNEKKAVGEAHYSGMGLRRGDQGGPQEERNLGKKLKEGKYQKSAHRPVTRGAAAGGDPPKPPKNLQFVTRSDGRQFVTWEAGTGRRPRRWQFWTWTAAGGWSDMEELDKIPLEKQIAPAVKRVRIRAVDKYNRASDIAGRDRP
jgi:hypothetical protein